MSRLFWKPRHTKMISKQRAHVCLQVHYHHDASNSSSGLVAAKRERRAAARKLAIINISVGRDVDHYLARGKNRCAAAVAFRHISATFFLHKLLLHQQLHTRERTCLICDASDFFARSTILLLSIGAWWPCGEPFQLPFVYLKLGSIANTRDKGF